LTTPNVGGSYWTNALTQTPVKAAAYTANPNELVRVDTTSASVTVTLPAQPAAGTIVAVKMVTLGGSNTVTVTSVSGDVFNKAGGGTTATLSLLGQGLVLEYGAGIWMVLADDLPLSQLDARYDQQGVLTTLGDMLYENSTPAPARLAGTTSATKQFLTQTGTGTVSAAPAWGTIAAGDLPAATGSTQGAVVIGGTTFAPVLLGAGSLSAAQTANLLVMHTVYIPAAETLTGLAVANGATATGNVLVGIYNAAGSSLLASSASTAQTGTSSTQYIPFTGTYAAAAGTYILAALYSSSSATAPTAYAATPASTAAQGGFALPASVTPPTAAAGAALAVCATY
jgi:hypothetical protein